MLSICTFLHTIYKKVTIVEALVLSFLFDSCLQDSKKTRKQKDRKMGGWGAKEEEKGGERGRGREGGRGPRGVISSHADPVSTFKKLMRSREESETEGRGGESGGTGGRVGWKRRKIKKKARRERGTHQLFQVQ